MSIEFVGIRNGGGLWPATDVDKESLRKLKQRQAVKVTLVKQSSRSLLHHQLYWAGLVGLILDYWAPESGCLTPNEIGVADSLCAFLCRGLGDDSVEAITAAKEAFIANLKQRRADSLPPCETKPQDVHDWIKAELGMYELYVTPTGWSKRLKSINFNAMGSEEFKDFYRKAFGVAWRFVLSRQFDTQEEAENVINQLASMG